MNKILILGAGQLARMMELAGTPLNLDIKALDVSSNKVVQPLSPENIYGDLEAGIKNADVITAEFEHIAHDILAECEQSGKLYPTSNAIKIGGDRRLEKALLESCNAANAKHYFVNAKIDFDKAIEHLSLPIIFKTALEGYDGKGQWRLKSAADAEVIWQDMANFLAASKTTVKQGIVAEQMVPFDREVSLVGVRRVNGDVAVYPLTENHHTNGILSVSVAAPVNEQLQQQASTVFKALSDELDYVGVMAIEFFQVGDQLLVNEIAPRVHNSGHWTQQGADTCQFENHLRAICDLPLGSTALIRPTAMVNIIGEDTVSNEVLAIPSATIHWYNKGKRVGRKMGHINVSGESELQLAQRLQHLADILCKEAFPDLNDFAKNYLDKQS
ncbi:5-(carboxyamino)imidazole ribonucleotide synthase [Colwellia psychrerythraea]|uniref:N5-carboxyaminoimidazole ribonucleotide synthase n=1 Tax=Colwellia psychrerythraea (strain 34H / ATCC BAA-681) TaxID=167879 RepID=Q48AU3_COLP3|nr:5-(carboxyamino)imidazole ribonucleotide synthase [Colwellia psychrerythraea]AAZ27764.1 phosphoribosylaminoimidazole carboxylase, ATPase subunit [Colwellia psychrerythraea 34H]